MGEILNLREKDATEVPRRHSEKQICGDAEAAVSVEAGGGGQGDGARSGGGRGVPPVAVLHPGTAVLYCTVQCTAPLYCR